MAFNIDTEYPIATGFYGLAASSLHSITKLYGVGWTLVVEFSFSTLHETRTVFSSLMVAISFR